MTAQTARPIRRGDLFAEDFDLPPPRAATPPPSPEPAVEPTFSAEDLASARAEAFAAGEAAGCDAAATETAAHAATALADIARQLDDAAEVARAQADTAAEAVTQMILAGMAAAFPRLGARFGTHEVAALVQRILPSLRTEPRVAVHLAPVAVEAVRAVLARLDPDARERIRVVPDETLGAGDVRIAWEDGEAVRDGARLWADIEAILAPAGLLRAAEPGSRAGAESEAMRGEGRTHAAVVDTDLAVATPSSLPGSSSRSPSGTPPEDVAAALPRPPRRSFDTQRVKEPALGH
ncbi:MAG: hypothetical protein J0H67_17030 [Rhodospirillales bacterium]|nr:hypothetical protein [Rhodospirillales bacterium]